MMKLCIAAIVALTAANSGLGSAQVTETDARIQRGAAVYQYWCAPCHSNGRGNPGTMALAAKYKDRQPAVPAVLSDRQDLTPQSIRFFVRQGVSVMAPFRKTEISDPDLEALSAYLTRNKR
jgi:(+)-pinoresinol hydroxylase